MWEVAFCRPAVMVVFHKPNVPRGGNFRVRQEEGEGLQMPAPFAGERDRSYFPALTTPRMCVKVHTTKHGGLQGPVGNRKSGIRRDPRPGQSPVGIPVASTTPSAWGDGNVREQKSERLTMKATPIVVAKSHKADKLRHHSTTA